MKDEGYEKGRQNSKFFFFSVLGFELKAYTLSHSTSPFFVCVMGFFQDRVSQTICQAGFKL
jgi:hypothetical protein